MSETVLTIEDAARCLPDLVDRVHASGDTALLTKAGRPLARIVAVPDLPPAGDGLVAFLRRWRLEHPDPDEQFQAAVEESRRSVQPPHDPWE